MSLPPRPTIALQVGVFGHRDLSGADADALLSRAAGLLRRIAAEVATFQDADQKSHRRAYLPDPPRLRCIGGLGVGADRVLARAALNEGWRFCAALAFPRLEFESDFGPGAQLDEFHDLLANASAVCELDGARGQGAAPYVDVGDFIIEHADLLIGIWDGQPSRSLGGTGDTVTRAIHRGRPVALINLTDPSEIVWRNTTSQDPRAIVAALLAPPTDAEFPAAYFEDARSDARWAVGVMRLYERLVSAHPATRAPSDATLTAPPSQGDPELQVNFEHADRLAIAYGGRYRVAGLMRYGLILPATLGSLVASLGDRMFQIGGNLAQFVVLAFLVAFSSRTWQEPTHRRFVAYRALAEQFRSAMILAPFAAVASLSNNGDWTTWMARASQRATGPKSMVFDRASLDVAVDYVRWITRDQIGFLVDRAERYERIARRFSRIGIALSISGIGFAGLRAALLFLGIGSSAMSWYNEAALLLPAMGPVFLGLVSFHEYRTLATRYRAIAKELEVRLTDLENAAPRRSATLAVARGISGLLLEESSDWLRLIKSHVLAVY